MTRSEFLKLVPLKNVDLPVKIAKKWTCEKLRFYGHGEFLRIYVITKDYILESVYGERKDGGTGRPGTTCGQIRTYG